MAQKKLYLFHFVAKRKKRETDEEINKPVPIGIPYSSLKTSSCKFQNFSYSIFENFIFICLAIRNRPSSSSSLSSALSSRSGVTAEQEELRTIMVDPSTGILPEFFAIRASDALSSSKTSTSNAAPQTQTTAQNPYAAANPYTNPYAAMAAASPYANPYAALPVPSPYTNPYANPYAMPSIPYPTYSQSPYANPYLNNPYASASRLYPYQQQQQIPSYSSIPSSSSSIAYEPGGSSGAPFSYNPLPGLLPLFVMGRHV